MYSTLNEAHVQSEFLTTSLDLCQDIVICLEIGHDMANLFLDSTQAGKQAQSVLRTLLHARSKSACGRNLHPGQKFPTAQRRTLNIVFRVAFL